MTSGSTLALHSAAAVSLLALIAFALAVAWCEHRRKTAIARACKHANEGS